jgi:3-methyl-2-oxobutanoate hydroxymethyltransferase
MSDKPITVLEVRARKGRGKLVMVTAYDATFAGILDQAGVDILLVGDSLGMVVQGHANTLPVTLDQVIYHTAAVARGARHAQVVADMPFMTYQVSPEQALLSAGRLVQEGNAHAVKLEGGERAGAQIEKIVAAGIPVMGHVGLTPQSVHELGGFKLQGRDAASARQLVDDARAVERAGAFALVLEGIPAELAAEITSTVTVPTIGIGAGPSCDGQVLVCYDMLGMNPAFKPRFLKTYAELHGTISDAARTFAEEVRSGQFPAEEHTVHTQFLQLVRDDDPDRVFGVPV